LGAGTATTDLACIGPDAIPALLAALTNQNCQVRQFSAMALGGIGQRLRPITRIKGPDGGVRYVLGAMEERYKPQIKPAVTALLQRLKDKDRGVRGDAAFALKQCDADPSSAVPALIVALKSETNYSTPMVWDRQILAALAYYGTNASAAVPLLLKIAKSRPRPLFLNPALAVLRRIDPEAAKPLVEDWQASLTNNAGSAGK
jgi:HEAT repeat protein